MRAFRGMFINLNLFDTHVISKYFNIAQMLFLLVFRTSLLAHRDYCIFTSFIR